MVRTSLERESDIEFVVFNRN